MDTAVKTGLKLSGAISYGENPGQIDFVKQQQTLHISQFLFGGV